MRLPCRELVQARPEIVIEIALKNRQQFPKTSQHYQNAIALAPNKVEILGEFGEFLICIGKFAIARKIFQRCLKIEPDDFLSNLQMPSLA